MYRELRNTIRFHGFSIQFVYIGSRYNFLFQKLSFLKQKITRSDGGVSERIGFHRFSLYTKYQLHPNVTSSVFYEIATSYFIKNVSRT